MKASVKLDRRTEIRPVLACASALALTALTGVSVQAEDRDGAEEALAAAQERLELTFSNFAFETFEPAPIPGAFQVGLNGRLIYYFPESNHLMFGQLFDDAGTDLTAEALQRRARARLKNLDLTAAINVGDEGPEIIEFVNPDCGYCRRLQTFYDVKREEGYQFRRRIIFTAGYAPSREKAIAALCAEDPAAATETLLRGGVLEPRDCPEGRERMNSHAQMSAAAGVNGTPTLLVDGKLISGFRQAELQAFLDKGRRSATADRLPASSQKGNLQ